MNPSIAKEIWIPNKRIVKRVEEEEAQTLWLLIYTDGADWLSNLMMICQSLNVSYQRIIKPNWGMQSLYSSSLPFFLVGAPLLDPFFFKKSIRSASPSFSFYNFVFINNEEREDNSCWLGPLLTKECRLRRQQKTREIITKKKKEERNFAWWNFLFSCTSSSSRVSSSFERDRRHTLRESYYLLSLLFCCLSIFLFNIS